MKKNIPILIICLCLINVTGCTKKNISNHNNNQIDIVSKDKETNINAKNKNNKNIITSVNDSVIVVNNKKLDLSSMINLSPNPPEKGALLLLKTIDDKKYYYIYKGFTKEETVIDDKKFIVLTGKVLSTTETSITFDNKQSYAVNTNADITDILTNEESPYNENFSKIKINTIIQAIILNNEIINIAIY